jgi:glycosyltransferase involved in cell wall biosynthesis
VVGPSRAILDRLAGPWNLPRDRLMHVPNVFIAPPELLAIPPESATGRVTFLGRLEVRKGVLELASAIPLVLAQRPDARFRFIGRTLPMPSGGRDVRAAMLERIGRAVSEVEFIDAVAYDQVPGLIAESDICAYPSVWENFPNVCIEAMAAARGVIGSSAGGMAEIIEHGRTGLLVPPKNPRAIAEAILELLNDPARRIAMGRAARAHVTTAYSPEVIGPLQEESYRRAIAHARKRRAAA